MTAQGPLKEGRFETTRPLMRPDQVQSFLEEGKRITSMLNDNRPHVAALIQDRAASVRQLTKINQQIDEQMPRKYEETEIDAAIDREAELRETWMVGMPTQSEMRQNPAGATDKHIGWERRNKEHVLEWKNVRRRLLMSEAIDAPIDSRDIANIEMFRPFGGTGEMNLHNQQITPTDYHMPPNGPAISRPFSTKEVEALRALSPELVEKLAVADTEVREEIRAVLEKALGGKDESAKGKGGK